MRKFLFAALAALCLTAALSCNKQEQPKATIESISLRFDISLGQDVLNKFATFFTYKGESVRLEKEFSSFEYTFLVDKNTEFPVDLKYSIAAKDLPSAQGLVSDINFTCTAYCNLSNGYRTYGRSLVKKWESLTYLDYPKYIDSCNGYCLDLDDNDIVFVKDTH